MFNILIISFGSVFYIFFFIPSLLAEVFGELLQCRLVPNLWSAAEIHITRCQTAGKNEHSSSETLQNKVRNLNESN